MDEALIASVADMLLNFAEGQQDSEMAPKATEFAKVCSRWLEEPLLARLARVESAQALAKRVVPSPSSDQTVDERLRSCISLARALKVHVEATAKWVKLTPEPNNCRWGNNS